MNSALFAVLQSGDYKKIYIVRIDEKDTIDVPSEFIMGFPYLVKLSGYSTGVYEKHKIWADIQNAPKVLLFYVIDVDFRSDIKKKLKENLSTIDEELYHYKVLKARELLRALENVGIPRNRILFMNSKTSFHILIKPQTPIPFNDTTFPIVEYEQSQYENIVKNIIAKYNIFEIDPWKPNKATYREGLDIDIQLNSDYLAKIFQEYIEEDTVEEKDHARLQNVLPQMVEEFRTNPNHEGVSIFGGQHHSFILLLAGELAKSGFTLEEAIKIYDEHFTPYDNPKDYRERLAIIKHTYNRYQNKQPILSWRNLRPEWRLSRAQKLPEITLAPADILARGVKSFIFPHKGKMIEKRVANTGTKNKPKLLLRTREIPFPYVVEPLKFENDKIHYILYNENEHYSIISPFPSTSENIKGFEQSISHLPLTRHQVRSLRTIIENFIAFRDYWGKRIEIHSIYNEREGFKENDTGYSNVYKLWNSKAFRIAISLAIAKYQNPELPNPVFWIWGDTGTGKSRTLSQIAQAFAEKPLLNATYNALETYASTLYNKPLIIDDLAVFRDKIRDIFDLVFTTHAGIGKARRTAVAGSQRIDVRGLSASVFMASEMEPQTLLQLKQGEIGVLRRVFILQMEKTEYPSDLTDGKGWVLFLKKITPSDDDYQLLQRYPINEWHARAYLPYVSAIYRIFNDLFGTDFDPYAEFYEITQHLESVITHSIQKSIENFVKSHLLENTNNYLLIYDPIEHKLVLPEIALSLIAPRIGTSVKNLQKILDENFSKTTITHPKFRGLMLRGWNLIQVLETAKEVEDEGDIEV